MFDFFKKKPAASLVVYTATPKLFALIVVDDGSIRLAEVHKCEAGYFASVVTRFTTSPGSLFGHTAHHDFVTLNADGTVKGIGAKRWMPHTGMKDFYTGSEVANG